MVRFVIIAVVVVAAFAAVEARVGPIVAPTNLVTNPLGAVIDNGRKITGVVDECAWTCDHVSNKKMCHTLRKLPGVSSPRELLTAAVRLSMRKAKAAKARFEAAKAAAQKGTPMESILDTCSGSYDNTVSALQDVQRCIDTNDSKANLITKMSAATTFTGDCANAYDERELEPSLALKAAQHNVDRVVSGALAIAAKLKQ
uniref:Pectinesterase inhibitor domain-containing protein n=1 Tax=Oryza punctata TaxID=4537 RepID=A0A0E0L585_ORYPU